MKNNDPINKRIVEMKKNSCGLFTIHKWITKWNYFFQLDELIVLAHILNVLDKNKLAVSRNQVKYCLNKFFNRDFHGDKKSYLAWMYERFNIKQGTLVQTSKARYPQSKPLNMSFSEPNNNHTIEKIQQMDIPLNTHKNLNFPIIKNV